MTYNIWDFFNAIKVMEEVAGSVDGKRLALCQF